jgi:hypothetical protein
MGSFDYTTVLGIDESHLRQLELTWPTWIRFKPSLLDHPLIVFCDRVLDLDRVRAVISEHADVQIGHWPPAGVEYPVGTTKWDDQQRYKMLAGFVHVPPMLVCTPYWLKLDTDTVATDMDDWIEESWFKDTPAIVAPGWPYTKPPDQVIVLDKWADDNKIEGLSDFLPLDLRPSPGSDLVRHKRIISWCGFFNTEFSRRCSKIAEQTCGRGKLPVPSQDGFHFYVAKRGDFVIRRENMKSRGWRHESSLRGIINAIDELNKREGLCQVTSENEAAKP